MLPSWGSLLPNNNLVLLLTRDVELVSPPNLQETSNAHESRHPHLPGFRRSVDCCAQNRANLEEYSPTVGMPPDRYATNQEVRPYLSQWRVL